MAEDKKTEKKASKTEVKKVELEREYVIPLRARYQHVPRYKKTPKAIKTVKEFLVKHMKIRDRDLNKIKLDQYLNEFLWGRGIKNPPHKVKVKAKKEGDIVRVELVDYSKKLQAKKARADKAEKKAKEAADKKKAKAAPLEKKVEDENKDGVEDKKEESEKKTAVAEAGQKQAKDAAKKAKHQTDSKAKQPKRPVRQSMQK